MCRLQGSDLVKRGSCGADAGRRILAIGALFLAGQKDRLVPIGADIRRSGSIAQLYGGKQAISKGLRGLYEGLSAPGSVRHRPASRPLLL